MLLMNMYEYFDDHHNFTVLHAWVLRAQAGKSSKKSGCEVSFSNLAGLTDLLQIKQACQAFMRVSFSTGSSTQILFQGGHL